MTRREFTAMAALAPLAAEPRPAMRIIDPHVHVWTQDPRYPWAPKATTPPVEEALPETLLKLMKANGVSHTVIIQVIYYRWDNRYARDVIRKYKGKFQGVCRIDPESPRAPDDLSRLVQEEGFAACGSARRETLPAIGSAARLCRRCGDARRS